MPARERPRGWWHSKSLGVTQRSRDSRERPAFLKHQMKGQAMSGRHVETHKVNGLNEAIHIRVQDDPGPGGANHRYCLYVPNDAFNEELNASLMTEIAFQKGPIKENGVNGWSNEALLAIVRDRLEGFQSGPFACDTNQLALTHVKLAMDALHSRTKERLARGVEGTNQK